MVMTEKVTESLRCAEEFSFDELVYRIPYHLLLEFWVEIETVKGTERIMCHLPGPFFSRTPERISFILSLAVSPRKRDENFFHCNYCGKKSARTLKDCGCLKENISSENEAYIQERKEYERMKEIAKDELLAKIDAGEKDLGILDPVIILSEKDADNDRWYLPEIDESKPAALGRCISLIHRKVDEFVRDEKIPPLKRVDGELFLIDPERKYREITSELEDALGFKIPDDYYPFQIACILKFESCQRCNTLKRERELIQLVNGPIVCCDCAREDPVVSIAALLAVSPINNYIDTTVKVLDPDTLEAITSYYEVTEEQVCKAIGLAVIIKVVTDKNNSVARYFIKPFERVIVEADTQEESEIITEPEEYGRIEDEEEGVIIVEGSEEVRRRSKGVWHHRHGIYDYWHPMARVHKELREKETAKV